MSPSAVAIAALAIIPFAPPLPEMLPHPSAYRMTSQARAVVEGTLAENGVVSITERYWVRPGDKIGAAITVPALRGIDKAKLRPDSVVLFLADNPRGDVWGPMHNLGGAARGVIWLEGEAAWGYGQKMNPGGYSLMRWGFGWGRERVEATAKTLRQEVRNGVVARKQWQATLRVKDPVERAAGLVRWFGPKTSPDGKRWRERLWPELMQACDVVGEPIVKPLARIVQVGADPDVVVAAGDALARLGRTGQAAVPAFIARLRDPRGVKPIFLVRSLRSLSDPRAVDVLRDYVAHEDLFVAVAAAKALHASGAKDVVALLAPRVPKTIDDAPTLSVVASMLEVIHDLEPAVAERLVVERFLDHGQLMMQRPWLRRLRDAKKR